jgi:hypothetical protein
LSSTPEHNVKIRENALIECTVEKHSVHCSVGKEAKEDIDLSPQGAMTYSLHREKAKRMSSHGVVEGMTAHEVTAQLLYHLSQR